VVRPKEKGRREKMAKAISQARGGHNLRMTMVIAALAVVLLVLTLVAVFKGAPTTGGTEANPTLSAEGSLTDDPYIDRHAEVVERLGGGSLR